METELNRAYFASTEGKTPRDAPDGYVPQGDFLGEMVYDDEVEGLDPNTPWRRFFAGGSNRIHFVATDGEGNAHFIEQRDMEGSYEAYGPGYGEKLDDVRDAFYLAEREMARAVQ